MCRGDTYDKETLIAMLATIVCSACGLESEQDVDLGSMYVMQCSCSTSGVDYPELVEVIAEGDEPTEPEEEFFDAGH